MQIIKTSVIENIKHNFEELFPAEKKTAQYILDHLEEDFLTLFREVVKSNRALVTAFSLLDEIGRAHV